MDLILVSVLLIGIERSIDRNFLELTRIEIVEADESEPFGIDFVEFEYCYAADGFSPGFSANQIIESYTWQRIGLRWVSNYLSMVV